jgi:hypothetical protein
VVYRFAGAGRPGSAAGVFLSGGSDGREGFGSFGGDPYGQLRQQTATVKRELKVNSGIEWTGGGKAPTWRRRGGGSDCRVRREGLEPSVDVDLDPIQR